MKEKIRNFAMSMGLAHFGVCEPEPGTQALVFLFPYYVNEPTGTISLYARGIDYHLVAKKLLLEICSFLKTETGNDFSNNIYCDISPFNDKEIAFKAGLGFYGKNTLLINPSLGSYFFIGYILTFGLTLENDSPLNMTCKGCNACINSCPGNALENGNLNILRCASNISQKKGELSTEEQKILFESGFVWGCDCCQQVCPHNRNLGNTSLPEFLNNRLSKLSPEELFSISEKQFREKYKARAFTWRGKNTLLRNLNLFSK